MPGRFRIALSFPGEHRERVREIAELWAREMPRKQILYDKWYDADFGRPNLDPHISSLYAESQLLVFFLCATYNEREWCGLEWRVGRDLIKQGHDDRIMILRLDDAEYRDYAQSTATWTFEGLPAAM